MRGFHLGNARLLEMAYLPEVRASLEEDAHLDNCSKFFKTLLELVRKIEERRIENRHITEADLEEIADKKRELSEAEVTHIAECDNCRHVLAKFLKRYVE